MKKILLFVYDKPVIFMPIIILCWGLFYILFLPVINMDAGLGYDGHYYGHIARRFFSMVFGNQVDAYRIQRIVPPFVVYVFMNLFGISSSLPKIVLSFQIYNMILLQLGAVVWCRISGVYNFKLKYIWLGFVFWFLNFGVAEMAFYYPVLTDISALFVGFFLLYAHLKNNLLLKIILTFLGAFTWPMFLIFGILLLIFPVTLKPKPNDLMSEEKKKYDRYYLFVLPLPFLCFGIYKIADYYLTNASLELDTEIIYPTIIIGLVLNYFLSVYFFKYYLPVNFSLRQNLIFFKNTILHAKTSGIVISVVIFLILKLIQNYLSNDNPVSGSYLLLFHYISLYGATKPLVYLVTYIIYFGPMFIVFFMYLKYVAKYIPEMGTGIYLFFIIPVLTIFATEARLNIFYLPFFLIPVLLFLKDLKVGKNNILLFTLISFLLSRVYLPMHNVPDRITGKMTFNNQLLFMNFHTISINSYLVLAVVIILFSLAVYLSLRKSKNYTLLKLQNN